MKAIIKIVITTRVEYNGLTTLSIKLPLYKANTKQQVLCLPVNA